MSKIRSVCLPLSVLDTTDRALVSVSLKATSCTGTAQAAVVPALWKPKRPSQGNVQTRRQFTGNKISWVAAMLARRFYAARANLIQVDHGEVRASRSCRLKTNAMPVHESETSCGTKVTTWHYSPSESGDVTHNHVTHR